MNSEANKLLEALEADTSALISRPASDADIEGCMRNLEALELPLLPEDYIKFLQICNGLAWNGIEFYGTSSVTNSDPFFILVDVVVFAKSKADYYKDLIESCGLLFLGRGDEDLFAYNVDRKMYEIYDVSGMDVMEEYKYFDNLFLATVGGN
jgi:hypothetical protein